MFRKSAPACLAPTSGPDGLAQLGRSLFDLRGIRFSDAGATNPPGNNPAPPANPAAPPAAPPAADPANPPAPPANPATPPADPAAPKVPDSQQPPVGGVPFTELPKETQDEVRRLRADDQKWRQQLAAGMTEERRNELGKLLGFVDETPDPAQLAGKVGELTTRAESAESRANDFARANMVLLVAPDAGANAGLLLDSKGFAATIAGLDPSDKAGIKTAIETWVKDNPAHAATVAGRALPPVSGPRQQGQPHTPSKPGLEGAIGAAMGQQPRQ